MKARWLLLCLVAVACAERRPAGTAGWAAQVPSNAVRYVAQAAPLPTAQAQPVPAPVAPPAEPVARPFVSAITEPTTITLWHAYRATEADALRQVVERFHALGTKLTVQLRAVPFDAMNDKMKVVVPEGKGPDLVVFAHDLVGAWAEMGIIEPLSSLTTEEDTAGFLPETVQPLVYKSALYGLPLAFKCVALYYDTARIPTPPRTWDELVALAKQHTSVTDARFGLVGEVGNLYFHAPWLLGLGGEVLGPDDEVRIDSPAAVEALLKVRSLVKEHRVVPPAVTTAMVSGYFNDKKAAMALNGPWMRGEIDPGVRYGVAPLPELAPGKPARPFLGVEALMLNHHTTKKAAALEVMRYLVRDESAQLRFEVAKQTVANRRVWQAAEKSGALDPTMAAFRAQAAVSVPMSSSPRMQQMWTPYNDALHSVLSGDAEPAAALKEAQATAVASAKAAGGGARP